MHVHTDPRPDGPDADPLGSGDEARKRAIAQALWTEIHWLMPADRAVTIIVNGDDISVAFGPDRPASRPAAH